MRRRDTHGSSEEVHLKICVLVKEVPDAAVEKRINPSTAGWTAAVRRT